MSKWLKCKVEKGMFSDEYTVSVLTRNGETVSVFVPKTAARKDHGRVKVRVSEQGRRAIALLPDEHQSVVDVQSSDLIPA